MKPKAAIPATKVLISEVEQEMSDVFISYARPDEPQAKRVADALRAAGYRAWRDDELPAHRAYAEVIEERLKARQGGRGAVVGRRGQVAMGSGRSRLGASRRNAGPG